MSGVRKKSTNRGRAPAVDRPRRLRRDVRQRQLLEVALKLFIERGYQGTSIEDLARAAGVTRPIVYAHFGSKDGVYLACLRQARATLDQLLTAEASRTDDPLQRLECAIDGYFTFVERDRNAWHLLFGGGSAVAGSAAEEVSRLRFATVGKIAGLLDGVFPAVEPQRLEAFAHALSGAGEQLAKWWFQNPRIPRRRLIALFMDFAWGGLQDLQGRSPVRNSGRRSKDSGAGAGSSPHLRADLGP